MGYDQEIQDAWNPLSSSRKWTPLQANARHLDHHQGTNARKRRDNSNPASQDCERCGVRRLQEYNCSSAEDSRMDIPREQILPDDQGPEQEKRMEWACENFHKKFENIVWTDESMIQLENHRTFSYRKVGEPPRPKARAKHPYKVMVWAGISRKGATNICLLNKSMNSAVYQVVLQSHLVPFLQEHLPDGSLQQDNAPCHVSKATQKFLKDNNIPLFKTPPESPDCQPYRESVA